MAKRTSKARIKQLAKARQASRTSSALAKRRNSAPGVFGTCSTLVEERSKDGQCKETVEQPDGMETDNNVTGAVSCLHVYSGSD